ncbi:MAG: T9SS type A sorting domain-containing protein [Cytophagaceae bacterium]
MNRIILSLNICFLLITYAAHSQDARITGGNSISGMICSNGDVYTWGKNDAGLTGSLGNGSAAATVTSPAKVLFPATDPYFSTVLSKPVTMYAADAGSGQTFTSMDCYGGVWSWGFNGTNGITGTGSAASAVLVPARVQKGETPGGAAISATLTNYLVNAKYIAGGNESGFAVLKDGTAVGWGENSAGQLGNGTLVDSPAPKYIRNPDGSILSGVIRVDAGDQTGYALVDPDGDGIGTVYSFGGGGVLQLGRNSAGTANNGSESGNDPWARPVIMTDGTQLSGIVTIAAGDAMCFALDTAGYIWAWGNNGWGTLTGTGFAGGHSDPKPVAAGEWGTTAGPGLGLPFLKAKSIAAGQGFGMAVSIDGKPMAWGNNGACGAAAAGGYVGDGTTTTRSTPVFIRRSATVVDNNVGSISSGDTWGFYITQTNQIYTWGNNALGTLGIGSTTCQAFATPMTPSCSLPDPSPATLISPRDMGLCPAASQVLNSGFTVSAALAPSYSIIWERSVNNGSSWSIVQTGTGANPTYTATQTGMYKVTIKYTGTNIPCAQDAKDSISLYPYTIPFTTSGTYCAPNGTFTVTNNAGYTGWYDWYNASSAGTKLNAAYTNTITVPLTQAVYDNVNNTYTTWVTDLYGVEGYDRTSLPAACTPSNATPTNYHHKFTVSSAFTLESVMAMQYTNSNAGTYDQFRVVIYNDNAGAVGTTAFTGALSTYVRGPVGSATPITIPANWSATPGTYWLRIETTSSGIVKNYNCSVAFPQNDNTGQNLLSITATRQFGNLGTNFGTAYNWKISRGQPYPCGRVPVVAIQDCPLPVIFSDFNASLVESKVYLTWSTASEKNNNVFAVQRSSDGIHFETIGYVQGAGVSSTVKNYHFTDPSPLSGLSYYRIGQMDFDGAVSYSTMKTISHESSSRVSLYPNPFSHSLHVTIYSSSPRYLMYVMDLTGRVLYEKTLEANRENAIAEDLPDGLYLIKIIMEDGPKVFKVEKHP